MKLKRAITRAAGFCKAGSLMYFEHGTPGRVVVHSGRFSVIINLDIECPTLSCDAKELAKMLRGIKGDVSGKIENNAFRIGNENGALDVPITMTPTPVATPAVPADKLQKVEKWETIQQVFHAAATEKNVIRPVLQHVCFGKTGTGATDEGVIAFANVGIGSGQLFHATAFAKWPKGDVHAFLDDHTGWFRVDDEIRVIKAERAWFPRIPEILVKEEQLKFHARFNKKEFLDAISGVSDMSNMKQFRFYGSGAAPGYTLVPVYPKQMGTRFAKPLEGSKLGHIDLFLDGKRLTAAIKSYVGDEVSVKFGSDPKLPIRLCGEDFVEDFYPMMEVA